MKSSYELAMERLNKSAPSKKLTPEQKEIIQELESRYRAKIAERETILLGEVESARSRGDLDQVVTLQQSLRHEILRIESELEEKKEKVRLT